MMEIGLALGSAVVGPAASSERIRGLALAAERLGLHSVWVPDHVVIPVGAQSRYPYAEPGTRFDVAHLQVTYDPLATLPYLAGLTERVRLGVSVLVVPYRNPLVVAKWLASLDQLSGGRLLIGIGVGWLAEEFDVLGQPGFADRGAITDEYLEIWKAVWSEPVAAFAGQHYRFGPVLAGPRPRQIPHPPIHVGGNSRAALRRVLRVGAGWHLTRLGPEEVASRVSALRSALIEARRPPDQILVSARVGLDLRSDAGSSGRAAWVAGDIDTAVRGFRRYEAAGVGLLIPSLPPDAPPEVQLEMLDRLARDIVPRFGSGGGG
jgi:probable F420-dependent oxidoreductase